MNNDDILTFLDTAPAEIWPWAEEQKRRLQSPVRRATERWARPVVMAAVIAAVVFGVYYIGKPAPSPAPEQDVAAAPAGEAAGQAVDVARLAELTAQVEREPSHIDARLELGVLLMGSGDVAGAEEQWLAATQLDPERIEPWYNLGFLYLSQQPADTASARDAWQRVLEIDPDFPEADIIRNHMPEG